MTERRKTARGETWSSEEINTLLNIWKEEFVDAQLSSTHRNSAVYDTFSKLLKERGFNRSIEQCRTKVKKLRADYIKIRDELQKTGSDGSEKDKLPWYDQLHEILGGKPVVDPVDVVESCSSHKPTTPSTDDNTASTINSPDEESTENPCEAECGPSAPNTREKNSGGSNIGGRIPVPGSEARKRKKKLKNVTEVGIQEYMEDSKKMMTDICEMEKKQLAEEAAALKELVQAQRDSEEKRFQAMQDQFQSTNQMLMQLMGTIASALNPTPPSHPSSASPWTTTPPPASSSYGWSVARQYPPLPVNSPPQLQMPPTLHPTVQQELRPSSAPGQLLMNTPPPHHTFQHQLHSTPPSVQLPIPSMPVDPAVHQPPHPIQLQGLPPQQPDPEDDNSSTIVREAFDVVNPQHFYKFQ